MVRPIGDVLVDGVVTAAEDAVVSVFDLGFQRGYGCFEAMRCYAGTIFRLEEHLGRLAASAAMLHLPLPPGETIGDWCRHVAAGDSIVRVLVSGGTDPRNVGSGSRVFVYAERLDPFPDGFSVQLRVAPWHSDGSRFELTGAKALSYGFNLAATVAARLAGHDDALLVGESGYVLEGPTYSIAWVGGGTVFTPTLELGILESITRTAVIEACARAGVPVEEGAYPVDHLLSADEVLMMSTVREVRPVVGVDGATFRPGVTTGVVAGGFAALVAEEVGG